MGKIRRGYVFITWLGDHDPKHLHVFKNGKELLKWNLEAQVAIEGKAAKRVKNLTLNCLGRENYENQGCHRQ